MVFIPFIFMTVITTLLLFIFGLDPQNGKLNYSVDQPNKQNNTTFIKIVKKLFENANTNFQICSDSNISFI